MRTYLGTDAACLLGGTAVWAVLWIIATLGGKR